VAILPLPLLEAMVLRDNGPLGRSAHISAARIRPRENGGTHPNALQTSVGLSSGLLYVRTI